MEQVYIAVRRSDDPNDELQHYGVKGMRWGIRRASKQFSTASTSDQKVKAVAKLQKHRAKASAQISKLEKKHSKLEKSVEKHITKNDIKAAKLSDKAAAKRKKAYGRFTSQSKSEKLTFEANKIQAKADSIAAKSKKAKAKLAKNETMQAAFKKGVREIDSKLVGKGRKYING